jgi:hypothetical protein
VKALTPVDLQKELKSTIKFRKNHTVLVLGIGTHSACYHPLQHDMDQMTRILPQMRAIWKEDLLIRSAPATGVIRGLDYNDKKCLYYTSTRLQTWNNHLKLLAQKHDIAFWDVYNVTASVGPSPGDWVATDGTHYCFPSLESNVCKEMVSMLQMALTL